MGRLALTIKQGGSFKIGDEIVVDFVKVKGNNVRISIQAPRSLKILRSEIEKRDNFQDGKKDSAEQE